MRQVRHLRAQPRKKEVQEMQRADDKRRLGAKHEQTEMRIKELSRDGEARSNLSREERKMMELVKHVSS
jgi:hypothetical protein